MWKKKLMSRKFWISMAAMLGSIGTSIAGLALDNQTAAIVGIVCTVASSAIYAFAEAYVDAANVGQSSQQIEEKGNE